MIRSKTDTRVKNLKKRALILQSIRGFFASNGYLEVETPVRCPTIIPEAHIDPVQSEGQFLQASPELCMKRLLSQGFERLFQICKCFRKNERGDFHLPELTLLEWYAKERTYLDLMSECENLILEIASNLGLGQSLTYSGADISLTPPWERLSVQDAFEKYAGMSLEKAIAKDCFDEVISFEIEPELGHRKPVFLYDYPSQFASLAKLNPKNKKFAQRFELYINGVELANAFTELTDPDEQRHRFADENRRRVESGNSSLEMPEKFLSDLARLNDTAGIALGVDRLVMIFCNAPKIDEVVAFTPETL